MTDPITLIQHMSPEFLRENQDAIDDILFYRLRDPEDYEARPDDAHDYSNAIVWAAFWIGFGLAMMGFGIGGYLK